MKLNKSTSPISCESKNKHCKIDSNVFNWFNFLKQGLLIEVIPICGTS